MVSNGWAWSRVYDLVYPWRWLRVPYIAVERLRWEWKWRRM